MIYGRVIIVGQHYYNKIMDIEGISYFSNISGASPRFISIDSDILDRKMFNYSGNLLLKEGETLEEVGITLEQFLTYTPFCKGADNQRVNYYKNKKMKFNSNIKPITIDFD